MPENIIKNLGKAIKDARKSHNLTQDNLSELTGISKRHIANIENGKANASIEIIRLNRYIGDMLIYSTLMMSI